MNEADNAPLQIPSTLSMYFPPMGELGADEPLRQDSDKAQLPLADSEHQPFELWQEWQAHPLIMIPNRQSQHKSGEPEEPTAISAVERSCCVTMPTSNFRMSWDVLGIPVLFYDIMTIPLGAFDLPVTWFSEMMFFVILIYWSLDMVLNFRTGYFDLRGNLVMTQFRIARRYFFGLFFIDLVIVLNDWLPLLAEGLSNIQGLRMLRILRMARFLRLLRLRKLRDINQTIEDHFDSDYFEVTMKIAMDVSIILIINHILACLWFWLGSQKIAGYDSWVREEGYGEGVHWLYQYVTCLHWSISQFTPGSMDVGAHNPIERIFSVGVLMFALVVFSAFVSNLTQARLELQRISNKLGKDWYMLRKLMRQQEIPRQLAIRVEKYVTRSVLPRLAVVQQKDVVLLNRLSEPLRKALGAEMYGRHILQHPFFKLLDTHSKPGMMDLCAVLLNYSLGEGDILFRNGQIAKAMHFVVQGKLLYQPTYDAHGDSLFLEATRWFCEAVLWTKWLHCGRMEAVVETELIVVNSESFRKIMASDYSSWGLAREYAVVFVQSLNDKTTADMAVHDIHEDMASKFEEKNFLTAPATD